MGLVLGFCFGLVRCYALQLLCGSACMEDTCEVFQSKELRLELLCERLNKTMIRIR